MDAVALDDLDLDGMFADDGDMLFEGLDIGLDDAMGDIISNEKPNEESEPSDPVVEPVVAPPPPKTKRMGGPRTKRTNPMLEKLSSSKEEKSTAGSSNKRRKTKRKSKAPTTFGEEEDDQVEELLPPKKKRKSATKTKRVDPVVATTKTKRKKKNDINVASMHKSSSENAAATSGVTKMLSTKASAIPSSSVMVSGQIGGRLKKAATTKIRRKLKKSTIDSTSESTASDLPVLLKPPKPEPTFGGLHPSKTLFYPFLESVPVESTMQKRKTYPVMDRISSTLASQLLSYTPKLEDIDSMGITENSPIFKLMLDTYEGNEKDKKNFTSEKRTLLLKAISLLRKVVEEADKKSLVKDVFAMCGLLTREYNFLKQTLENMKAWCLNEFDLDKYKETYEPRIEQPKITKWKCTVGTVRVKVVYSGFRATKGNAPMFATLPVLVCDSFNTRPLLPSSASTNWKAPAANELKKGISVSNSNASGLKASPITPTKKKRKEKENDKFKTKIASTSSHLLSLPIPKTYVDLAPLARRQQIIERVSQLAFELESSIQKEKIVGRFDAIPDEQPLLHTTRMWDWVQSAGFYNKSDSRKILASIKSPKTHFRDPLNFKPKIIQSHGLCRDEEGHQLVSPASLFDRLQSLLVEVDSEDEMDYDEDKDSGVDSLDFFEHNVDRKTAHFKFDDLKNSEACGHPNLDIADLSELSNEERTFVHLSQTGLIKKSVYPLVILTKSSDGNRGSEREDLGDIIGAMSNDLTRTTFLNNARISYIERLTSEADVYCKKQVEDEQVVLIARCQNLMKRTKERAKKARQKKDENLNLPW